MTEQEEIAAASLKVLAAMGECEFRVAIPAMAKALSCSICAVYPYETRFSALDGYVEQMTEALKILSRQADGKPKLSLVKK